MIQFTEAALGKLGGAVEPSDFVRVGVVNGGCAGLSYTIEIEEESEPEDFIFEVGEIKICMNQFTKHLEVVLAAPHSSPKKKRHHLRPVDAPLPVALHNNPTIPRKVQCTM